VGSTLTQTQGRALTATDVCVLKQAVGFAKTCSSLPGSSMAHLSLLGQNELTESQAQHVLKSLPNCRLPT